MAQCKEMVYVRDTYRRTGRGQSGFEMHYTCQQCKRKAGVNGYCWQHSWRASYEYKWQARAEVQRERKGEGVGSETPAR